MNEFAQIMWPDPEATRGPGSAAAAAAAYTFGDWGGRAQGSLPLEGQSVSVLSIPDLPGAPQAIGVNLFRSDRQATLFNSDVRCRVTYGAGRSGQMTFDADWRGGFVVHATRLTVEAVGYKLPSAGAYQAATQVILSATAGLNGSRPTHAPTYTVQPEAVVVGATRQIEIPLLSRRVAVLLRYGLLGTAGDAPLGQLFVSFADALGTALAWIDCSTTRGAVFGEGLSLPAGARYLGLSNNSAQDITMGAIFHLGL